MNLIAAALDRKRLVLAAVALLSLIGLAAWIGMDRQEDPFFPYRYGHVLVSWPGAEPERMERLVLNILEEEIASVDEVNEINGTARLGFAHVIVGMGQHIYDTDAVWDRIRVAVDDAARRFPDGVTGIEIRDRSMDTHGVVLSITGSDDLLELLDAARQLRRDLFRVPDIGRIDLLGDPGEQLLITLDDARAAELGIGHDQLAAQLAERNLVVPGGTLAAGDRYLVLKPLTDFDAVEQLADTPITTAGGHQVTLSAVADIRLGPTEPSGSRIWHDGRPAVALGIVIPENRLNAVRFGEQLRDRVDQVRPRYEPLVIEEMFYQPLWVEKRLRELGRSLLIGVFIVATLLLTVMGLRLGLVVAGVLPLVTLSALAIYAIGGGVLHQMAIAGMVIALGMLVDNAIVMAENLQWHLDRGKHRAQAAQAAVRELAGPLAAATGTTLAAFTPLLLASGDTADFTRAIPIMVMLTLATSYLYAIFVTPTLAGALLKPGAGEHSARIEGLGRQLGALAVARPVHVLIGAAVIVAAALALSGLMQRDFFPSTDRNEFIIDLRFAEGTRVETSALKGGELASLIRELEGVEAVHLFAGFGGPRFYYNLIDIPNSPHLARLAVIAEAESHIAPLLHWTRRHARELAPEAQVVARRLGQGPPLDAPVEIRIFGEELGSLATASEQVMTALRDIPGATDIRHKLGEGMPTLTFEIDDAEAARHGISRREVAETLAGASLGREFSTWRAGREPLPMRLRSPEGENMPVHALDGLQVSGANGSVPLAQLVRTRLSLEPAVIEHRDLERMTAVLAETAEGVTYGQVIDRLMPKLDALALPDGVRIELGGAAAEADTANTALFTTLPIGILLLLMFLLWQFNSFRLVALVLVTVPLAAAGVIPGLILAGQPFSFTATLGVVALIGIVVNNAIVLLDVIGIHRAQGLTMEQAVSQAVGRRIRPILLTTATTIAGLLPLTFTQSTLWPPLAWAIISGLLAATVLTLMVIPAAYRLVMRERTAMQAAG